MAAGTENKQLKYIPSLDGVRALCIIGVMLFHLVAPSFVIGSFGVDIFFVLSGFLITTLLAQEWKRNGTIAIPRFYMRRLLRLTPALVVAIVVALVIIYIFGYPSEKASTLNGAWASLLYVSNWVGIDRNGAGLGLLGVNWSLAVEDQFYLIWPILLTIMLMKRIAFKSIIRVLGGAALVSALICYPIYLATGSDIRVWAGSDTRAQTLIVGCILGLLYTEGKLPDAAVVRRILPIVLLIVCVLLYGFSFTQTIPLAFVGGYLVFAVCTAIVLAYLLKAPNSRVHKWLSWKPLAWLGRISYGLYLWHGIVFWFFVPERFGWDLDFTNVLRVSVSLLAATASYYLVERHFLQLKSRYTASQQPVELPVLTTPIGNAQERLTAPNL